MPWCPVCKNEYREGITECADCKVPLVDSLDDIKEIMCDKPLYSSENEKLIGKFTEYLEYSGITDYQVNYNEENMLYTTCVTEADYEQARKLFIGFATFESQNTESDDPEVDSEEVEFDDADELIEAESESEEMSEEGELSDEEIAVLEQLFEDEDEEIISSNTFVKKEDQYKDYKFSGYSCILVGVVGLIFCLLNMTGILNMFPVLFSQIVMLVVFAGFLIGGIYMLIHSNKIREMIGDETKSIDDITKFLEENVTLEAIESIKDEETPAEINYFKYIEFAKEAVFEAFPESNSVMVDSLVEEHLSNLLQ